MDTMNFIGRTYTLNFNGLEIPAQLVGEGARFGFDDNGVILPYNPGNNVLFFRTSDGSEFDGTSVGDGIVFVHAFGRTAAVDLEGVMR